MNGRKFIAKPVFSGQYRKYNDYLRVWEIETDADQETTLEWCFENVYRKRIPEKREWHKNTMYGGEKWGDMNYHFNGWYEMHPIPEGFRFTVCEPYCD